MAAILVAPLGDHPVIVTASVNALRQQFGVEIERVRLLCPRLERIELGACWVGEELAIPVDSVPLPFLDANSDPAAQQYLQSMLTVLEEAEYSGDSVHLLLTGGRKNMSALTAVMAQFFAPPVVGMYHVLDRHESDPERRNLFTVDELNRMNEDLRRRRMHPTLETINCFEVPFPRFTDSQAIRDFLRNPSPDGPPRLTLDPVVEDWYTDRFQRRIDTRRLEVWLSAGAVEQFNTLWVSNRRMAERFRTCFQQMRSPDALRGHMHGTLSGQGRTFHFYKRRRTVERPLYYTLPDPIHVTKADVRQVVVCALSVEQDDGQYAPTGEELRKTADCVPDRPFTDLPKAEAILIAPLGDTPMVVTQAAVLLQRPPQGLKLAQVVIIHPGEHRSISNHARSLERAFKDQVPCFSKAIPGLEDVDSTPHCNDYLKAVCETIDEKHQENPNHEIHLLLSGGRKTMAAMNLFAAQRTGLSKVWHTLVKEEEVEGQIEDALEPERCNAETRRNIWLLRDPRFGPDRFDLFAVPVFPLG